MRRYDAIIGDGKGVLQLLHARFLLFHNSNLFLRDLQYGVREYLAGHGVRIGQDATEELARELARRLEEKQTIRRVDEQTWTLFDPAFRRPMEKPPAPVKPGAADAAPKAKENP